LMVLMANRYITPAAIRYQEEIASSVGATKHAGGSTREGRKLLDRFSKLIDEFRVRTDALAAALASPPHGTEPHARHMRDAIVPAMAALRDAGDQIELLTPHDAWPLPTYREMLFVK